MYCRLISLSGRCSLKRCLHLTNIKYSEELLTRESTYNFLLYRLVYPLVKFFFQMRNNFYLLNIFKNIVFTLMLMYINHNSNNSSFYINNAFFNIIHINYNDSRYLLRCNVVLINIIEP